jgi:hypothetical protein
MQLKSNKIIDVISEGFAELFEYFDTVKHISLLEGFLFLFSVALTLNLAFSDVQQASPAYKFIDQKVWEVIFSVVTITHFLGMFFKQVKLRRVVAYVYSFIWFSWAILTSWASVPPTASLIAVVCLMSIVLAVRLTKKKIVIDE